MRPPVLAEEHDQRAAALANAVLWVCVACPILYALCTLHVPLPWSQRLPLLTALAVPLMGLHLLRRGAVRSTSLLLVITFLIIPIWAAVRSGGVRSPSVTMLFIPVMLAGELLGTGAALVAATVAAAEVVILVGCTRRGLLPPPIILHTDRTYTVAMVVELMGAGAFAALAARLAKSTVSQLRDEQRAARDASLYLAETLEASPDALLALDDQGIIIRSNRAHQVLLERSSDAEIVGKHFLDAHKLPAADRERAAARFTAVMRGEPPLPFVATTHQRRDGSLASIEVKSRVVVRRGGARTLEVSIRDVTERVQAEQRQRQLEIQLEEARRLESVGRLASGVAHDFNNVLTVILASAAEAGAQPMLSLGQRQRLEIITDAAERGARLTQQLLTVARRHESRPQVVALGGALNEMRPFLRGLLGQQDHLNMTIADDPLVSVDPAQLDQVIVNLVVNARDAMPDGGRVDVSLRAESVGAGERPPLLPGPYAVLTVSDTGVGMEPDVLAHVFEPFFTTKGAGKGTGLGLATVMAVAQQAGGHVFVTSRRGEGTAFEVFLPRSEAASPPATASLAVEPAGRSGLDLPRAPSGAI